MTSRRLRRLIRRDSSTHRVHIVATAVDKTAAAAVLVVVVVLQVDFLAGTVGHNVLAVVAAVALLAVAGSEVHLVDNVVADKVASDFAVHSVLRVVVVVAVVVADLHDVRFALASAAVGAAAVVVVVARATFGKVME